MADKKHQKKELRVKLFSGLSLAGYLICTLCLLQFLTGCKTIIKPNYTTVERLSKLNPGMNKNDALQTLNNVYPYDILNGEKEGCEIHWYKYKHLKQSVFAKKINSKSGLRGGKEKYLNESNAYLLYKDGTLYSVHTSDNGDIVPLFASAEEIKVGCVNSVIKGCIDPESINYNPDAIESDESCKYCECGYEKNPNYNPNRPETNCNSPCVKIAQNK